jgi:hypothetical protein
MAAGKIAETMKYITITPITSDPKKPAFRDFKEQEERNSLIIDGHQFWCWDDSRLNNSEVGDLFAFFHTKSKLSKGKASIVFHRIVNIKNPTDRLPSWGKNIGQTDRRVLELSPPLETFTLAEWRDLGGHFAERGVCNGTQRVKYNKTSHPLLYKILSRI